MRTSRAKVVYRDADQVKTAEGEVLREDAEWIVIRPDPNAPTPAVEVEIRKRTVDRIDRLGARA